MKTIAAILKKLNQPLVIEELSLPVLKPGQVLVNVFYSGVCRSQLNEIHGLKGEDKFLPHTLGHEGSGKVLEVGQSVRKVKPGDHVLLTWIKGDGADVPSTVYQSSEGPINSGPISTFMRTTVISENRLVLIPKEMPLKEAALLGCAFPTGAGIVLNNAKVSSGDSVAVFGVGGIGLSSIMAAAVMDTERIIAVDVFDHKLELAHQIGATHVIDATKQEPLIEIMNITGGKGVDFAIEASGRVETMETAFESARSKGGKCIIAGNLLEGEKISINPMDLIRGKRIVGTWGGETNPDKDILKYVDWYLSGKIKLGKMITHENKLESINKTFDDFENGKVGRALIDMNQSKSMNDKY